MTRRGAFRILAVIGILIALTAAALRLAAPGLVDLAMFHPPEPATYDKSLDGLQMLGSGPESLAVRWHPLKNPDAPVLLYCHGNAEDIGQASARVKFFQDCGFSVLMWDYPGYGLSGGSPSEKGVLHAAEIVFRFLTGQHHIPQEQIVPYGFSIGSGPAVWLAKTFPVSGLILEGAFTAPVQVITGRPVPFLLPDPFPNRKWLAHVHCPLLVIHGDRDSVIPPYMGKLLFDDAAGKKTFYPVRGGRHGGVQDTDSVRYAAHLTAFRESLKAE